MEGLKRKIEETIETEPLKEFGLKFVTAGADKAVFETPGSDRKLVKISMETLRHKISEILHGVTTDKAEWDMFQKAEIAEQKKYEENIAEIFGKEHFLRKGVFRANIPLTKEILLNIVNENEKLLVEKLDDEVIYNIKMIAETQIIAEELKDPEKFETKSFNTDLITETNFRSAEDIQVALSRVREFIDKNFLAEYEELLKDEEFKKTVEKIIKNIIKFSKKTGLMIDIFGGDNITIFKKEDGSLDYHMLDVVLPGSQKSWEENIKNDKDLQLLRHYYTFFYSINSLGKKLGIEDSLEMGDLVYFKGGEIPTGKFTISENFYDHMIEKQ